MLTMLRCAPSPDGGGGAGEAGGVCLPAGGGRRRAAGQPPRGGAALLRRQTGTLAGECPARPLTPEPSLSLTPLS